jgi:hypothetical protein
LAGIRIEEPRPRAEPGAWAEFLPPVIGSEDLPVPPRDPGRAFGEVLQGRRSRIGRAVGWERVGDLLWHANRATGDASLGRAGLPVARRPAPSPGGLHPIGLVCINQGGDFPRLYDPVRHRFHALKVDAREVGARNAAAVNAVVGKHRGCTIRFVADLAKVSAAYQAPESLVLREAGCLLAVHCLCAEWLGLAACPLGFLGQDLVETLGFPAGRFLAAGGLVVGEFQGGP